MAVSPQIEPKPKSKTHNSHTTIRPCQRPTTQNLIHPHIYAIPRITHHKITMAVKTTVPLKPTMAVENPKHKLNVRSAKRLAARNPSVIILNRNGTTQWMIDNLYGKKDLRTLDFLGVTMEMLPAQIFLESAMSGVHDKRSWKETKPSKASSLKECEVLEDD